MIIKGEFCPKCFAIKDTYCWDERVHTYYDKDDDREYDMPVGYFGCRVCGHKWTLEDISVEGMEDITDDYRD